MITPELVTNREKVCSVECAICRSCESAEVKIHFKKDGHETKVKKEIMK